MSSGKGFGAVLRSSRLTQVSSAPAFRSNNPIYDTQKPHAPQRQVIGTTPASRVRQDFGLKNAMPRGWNSPYITLNSLDHNGMTKYDHGSSFYFKKRRFEEMGIALVPNNVSIPGFFSKPSGNKKWRDLSLKEVKEIVKEAPARRQEFLKYVRENAKRVTIENNNTTDELVSKFYGITGRDNAMTQQNIVEGNAGISYLLRGSMNNTNFNLGTNYGRPIQGRNNPNVRFGSNVSTVSVGGFISAFQGICDPKSKLAIESAKLEKNGEINLTSRLYGDRRSKQLSTSEALFKSMGSGAVSTSIKVELVDRKSILN